MTPLSPRRSLLADISPASIEPRHSSIAEPPVEPLPSLLERRAANPGRNAGVPPREWWRSWEPASPVPESTSNQHAPIRNDSPATASDELEEDSEPVHNALSTRYADLQTFKEAMERPDGPKWRESTNTEMNNHLENQTWDYVELPKDAKAIGSKWVFHLKQLADGSIECHRSREDVQIDNQPQN